MADGDGPIVSRRSRRRRLYWASLPVLAVLAGSALAILGIVNRDAPGEIATNAALGGVANIVLLYGMGYVVFWCLGGAVFAAMEILKLERLSEWFYADVLALRDEKPPSPVAEWWMGIGAMVGILFVGLLMGLLITVFWVVPPLIFLTAFRGWPFGDAMSYLGFVLSEPDRQEPPVPFGLERIGGERIGLFIFDVMAWAAVAAIVVGAVYFAAFMLVAFRSRRGERPPALR